MLIFKLFKIFIYDVICHNKFLYLNFIMSIQQRSRGWCYTINNYTEDDKLRLNNIDCRYQINGYEIGEQGTHHIQGYIYFQLKKSFNQVKKLLGNNAHIEKQRGNFNQAIDYCKKDGKFEERGKIPETPSEKGGETNKKRYTDARKAAEEGRLEDIPDDLYTRHMNSYIRMRDMSIKHDDLDLDDISMKTHFTWLYGPTGTGKSHRAREMAKELGCDEPYLKQLNKWWDGFRGQKVTIIEEADPKKCEHLASFFKQWADKWKFAADVKHSGYGGIRPEYIIVTSNYSIAECFPSDADHLPLKRRFNELFIASRKIPDNSDHDLQLLGVILDPRSSRSTSFLGSGMTFDEGETQAQKKRRINEDGSG